MYRRALLAGALLVAVLAVLFSQNDVPERPPYVQGRNKTVLFLVNSEPGLGNALVATASSMLENHADVEVHLASFPKLGKRLGRISEFARTKTPEASDIIFHELGSPSFEDAVTNAGKTMLNIPHPPGAAGIAQLCRDMPLWISPWTVEDHMDIYKDLKKVIDTVDPAVVVVDTLFRPAFDATRDSNRYHVIITPNTIVDNFLADQPYGSMFWKYPAVGSGFAFPVPLRNIPENIYLNMRFIYSILRMPGLDAKKAALRENGLLDPINFYKMYRQDVPWITMTTEDATVPVDYVPPNVTCAGPMVLTAAPAVEQDPDMVEWLKKSPTVLINLGSSVSWTQTKAAIMVQAVAAVMEKTDVQILWKFAKYGEYSDDVLSPVKSYLESGRLRMEKWLTIDPTSLLETGYFVASIHHGGSNCYHEAIVAGVPQIVLPQWADLYGFAALAETIGVGVWACRDTSPDWTVDSLRQAMLKVVDGSEASRSMLDTAKQLGAKVQARGKGRDIAASIVAKMAYAGK
ncbi:hypothetical protein EDB81DRAFT_130413 [Dactylonectria macrodidyma]|uniref:Erythromycin biosynthesis protein CIII-like C-terminal domain-containing protein n=1 Tax=Dactylonectria macrodidyma TaxID=307937 RepID=A0A9P9E5S2_9HYPO|nr:hypothetical protein EDB81DRAFT_130413 [Dactylonectria macrodidyma]